MLNKIKKKVNKFHKLVIKYKSYNFKEKYNPLINNNNMNEYKNQYTPTLNNYYYSNDKIIELNTCFLTNKSIELINIMNFIYLPEILIISVNYFIADALLCFFNKNINITLILYNSLYISVE